METDWDRAGRRLLGAASLLDLGGVYMSNLKKVTGVYSYGRCIFLPVDYASLKKKNYQKGKKKSLGLVSEACSNKIPQTDILKTTEVFMSHSC